MKVFDVSLHNNRKDCWVIINARVSKNVSEEFEEAGHGSAARLMLDEYYVGEARLLTPSSTTTDPKPPTHPKQVEVEENIQSRLGFIINSVGLLLPLAILGGVIGFMLYN
ncbi:hypothetical protein L1987_82120 [Smallanthus sonchifolius]|uniref:Uncharacterized protein n=1 Tax=Smallanthus sonchifolius TaxID=185202 RepID=A0ACB8YSL9_9ASTR|nr:hypothetical protein L1987_82120 [Smallanthus sonchifolius]